MLTACNNGGRGRVAGLNGTYNPVLNQTGVQTVGQPVRQAAPVRNQGFGDDPWGQFPSPQEYERYLQECMTIEDQNTVDCQYLTQIYNGMRGMSVGSDFTPEVGLRGIYGGSGRIRRWNTPYNNDQISGTFFLVGKGTSSSFCSTISSISK